MWRTQHGKRALKTAEWALFREGMGLLWDSIEMCYTFPEDLRTGVEVFDRLQPNQKLAMLFRVGKALRDRSEPAPDLTAITEGTVAAVFGHLHNELSMEIDFEDDIRREEPESADQATQLRRLIIATCREWKDYRRYKFPAESSKDAEQWDYLLEDLANRILWEDGDYAMAAEFIDKEPEEFRAKMAMMGIDPDYFVDIAPDPTDEQLELIRGELMELTGRVSGGVGG
jgi:hypothetical protein